VTGPVVHGELLAPGDLLIVTGTQDVAKVIEIGAVLVGDPAASHVAVYHHTDANGVPWALEGRPGGVGWRDATDYDRDPRTVTNAAQPKTETQRISVCYWSEKLIGTQYDWLGGIAEDALRALDPQLLWKPEAATGIVPGAVVCSSYAAWVYGRAGLPAPSPGDWRHVTPGAWSLFVEQRGWEHAA
jgi:hypothetical protein